MSKEKDKQHVDDFFEKHGRDTVAEHDLGYDCSTELTVNDLYDMFVLRMHIEEEFS